MKGAKFDWSDELVIYSINEIVFFNDNLLYTNPEQTDL